MLIPRMGFESHGMIYVEVDPDGSIWINMRKPEGWRCATCDDPDCCWLSHQLFPEPGRLFEETAGTNEAEEKIRSVRNGFQNLQKAEVLARDLLGIELFEGLKESQRATLAAAFQKRHPITHNLGVVDLKYLENVEAGDRPGRDVSLEADEVREVLAICRGVLAHAYTTAGARLLSKADSDSDGP